MSSLSNREGPGLVLALRGNFLWIRVPGYIVAQFVGATLASLVLQWMYGNVINGANEPTPDVSSWVAMLTEAVLTLALVSVILGAMIAVGFEYILKGRATKSGAEAAQGVLDDDTEGI